TGSQKRFIHATTSGSARPVTVEMYSHVTSTTPFLSARERMIGHSPISGHLPQRVPVVKDPKRGVYPLLLTIPAVLSRAPSLRPELPSVLRSDAPSAPGRSASPLARDRSAGSAGSDRSIARAPGPSWQQPPCRRSDSLGDHIDGAPDEHANPQDAEKRLVGRQPLRTHDGL